MPLAHPFETWSDASLALSALLLGGLLGLFEARRPLPAGSPLERAELVPPPPRLEVRPLETLEQVRARERELLEGYGSVDREAGLARIPIERAMAILAERGWPAADEAPQLPSGEADETFRPGARSPMVEERRGE